jgi:hypothetical protein
MLPPSGPDAHDEGNPTQEPDDATATWAEIEGDDRQVHQLGSPADARPGTHIGELDFSLTDGPMNRNDGSIQETDEVPHEAGQMRNENLSMDEMRELGGEPESGEPVSREPETPDLGETQAGDLSPPPLGSGASEDGAEEDMEPDLTLDPLSEEEEPVGLEKCTYEFFSALPVRKAVNPDGEALREELRGILRSALGPRNGGQLSAEEKADLEDWLQNVHTHTHDPEQFVVGSFNRHLPAWEELLRGSKRETSQRFLRILRSGVKPQLIGTGEAEPKKLDQVRAMLRQAVGPGKVESMLTGQIPHQVEFANHRSFYDNLSFGVGEVVKLVVNGTLTVYRPEDRKPKVVNPLGVVNLPQGRLVLNGRYPNAFSKKHPFKYETLREILTFLTQSAFFSTWDFKAGYYHVTINPAFRKYFGLKVGSVYFHYNAMCFGWSEACYIYTLIAQEAAKELRLRSIPVSSYLDDGFTGNEDFWRCVWAIIFIVRMLTVLGAVFSLGKCHFRPQQEGPWLGFVVET